MKATSKYGISNLDALEEYGRRGLEILEELVFLEQIKKVGNRYFLDKNLNAQQKVVQKLSQNLIKKNYDIESFGKKDNWLSLQYESVNTKEVMPKIRNILQNTNKEIKELLNSQENQGKDIVWISLAMDNLSPTKINIQ